MNFKKISLSQSGFKGAEVHFLEPNDRGVMELTKKGLKNPIHFALEKAFKDLRFHILNVYGILKEEMTDEEKAYMIMRAMVDSVELDGESIVLIGSHEIFEGKENNLKTFKIQELDGYEYYEDLKVLVDSICEEAALYMSGSKKVDEKELIMRWAQAKHKNLEITEEKIKGLTPEQLKDMALTIIEKGLGGMVHLPEELDMDSEDFANAVEDVTNSFDASEEIEVVDIAEVIGEDLEPAIPSEEGDSIEVNMDDSFISNPEDEF
jgi:hypothetical protein